MSDPTAPWSLARIVGALFVVGLGVAWASFAVEHTLRWSGQRLGFGVDEDAAWYRRAVLAGQLVLIAGSVAVAWSIVTSHVSV